jgi:hypothetical protein
MLKILSAPKPLHVQESIWPNPADPFITLKAPISPRQQPIAILNTTGQLIWPGELVLLQTEMVIAIDEIQSGSLSFYNLQSTRCFF